MSQARPVLTPRERQILELIAEGLTDPEIATLLRIGRRTVNGHVADILDKLSTRTRAAAVARALATGAIHPHESN